MSVPTTDEPVDFLSQLRVLAGREAAELGHSVVDVEHLLLAATRDELGCIEALQSIDVDRRRLRDFVMFICGVNEAHSASASPGLTGGRGSVNRPPRYRPSRRGHPRRRTLCCAPPPRPLVTTGPSSLHTS